MLRGDDNVKNERFEGVVGEDTGVALEGVVGIDEAEVDLRVGDDTAGGFEGAIVRPPLLGIEGVELFDVVRFESFDDFHDSIIAKLGKITS